MVRPRMAGPQLPWSLAIFACYCLSFGCEEDLRIACLRYMLEKEERREEERREEEAGLEVLVIKADSQEAGVAGLALSTVGKSAVSSSASPSPPCDANEKIYPAIRSHDDLVLSYSVSYLREFFLVECERKRGVKRIEEIKCCSSLSLSNCPSISWFKCIYYNIRRIPWTDLYGE